MTESLEYYGIQTYPDYTPMEPVAKPDDIICADCGKRIRPHMATRGSCADRWRCPDCYERSGKIVRRIAHERSADYMKQYRDENREAINAYRRNYRKAKRNELHKV